MIEQVDSSLNLNLLTPDSAFLSNSALFVLLRLGILVLSLFNESHLVRVRIG